MGVRAKLRLLSLRRWILTLFRVPFGLGQPALNRSWKTMPRSSTLLLIHRRCLVKRFSCQLGRTLAPNRNGLQGSRRNDSSTTDAIATLTKALFRCGATMSQKPSNPDLVCVFPQRLSDFVDRRLTPVKVPQSASLNSFFRCQNAGIPRDVVYGVII